MDLDASVRVQRIAFVSTRSGHTDLWVATADGDSPLQLTRFEGPTVRRPRWSPDGGRLAFAMVIDGSAGIYSVPATGSHILAHLHEETQMLPVDWTATGDALLVSSDRSGSWQIWSLPLDGGAPSQLTTSGAIAAAPTSDGGLVVARPAAGDLETLPPGGGPPRPAGTDLRLFDSDAWRLVGRSVVLLRAAGPDGDPTLARLELDSGELVTLATPDDLDSSSFSPSPDGRSLLYGRIEGSDSDLMSVDGLFGPPN